VGKDWGEEMSEHSLKTWPSFFEAVRTGRKTFEARRADRDFEVGDILALNEYDPRRDVYTGRDLRARVTYILRGGEFGIERGYCVMAIALEEAP
jgi:hypothetical protein